MDYDYDFRAPGGTPFASSGPVPVASFARMPMRTAYNRTGLSVLLCYAVASVVTSVVLAGAMSVLLVPVFREWFEQIASYGRNPDLIEWVRDLFSGSAAEWIQVLATVGSGVGFGASIPIIRKVVGYRSRVPVPKRTLSFPVLLLVILSAYGLWGVGVYAGNFIEFLGFPTGGLTSVGPENGNLFLTLIPLLYAVFGAPVIEELIFRKTLLDVLHPYGQRCAALVTALLFGLMHGNSGQFLLAFLLGLLFAAVYLKTGNILYTMLLHFVINLTASVPELLLYFGIDIGNIFETYILAGLTVAGLVTLFLIRKNKLFRLTTSAEYQPNRAMFRNPGMLIAVIGGTVMLVSTDALLILQSVLNYRSPVPLLALLSTAVSVLTVVLVCSLGGRRKKPLPADEPEDDTPPDFT